MDGEEILMIVLSGFLVIALFVLVVILPLDAYFDSEAKTLCRIAGYDAGYKGGLIFGDNICSNIVQEEVIEYFKLE